MNQTRVERQHPVSPLTMEEFHLLVEAVEPLRQLKAAGLVVVVTTNQPGLSRGHQSRHELDRMHELLRRRFEPDDILVCPHDESDHCPCRTPRPGLLIEAAFKWHLDLERSFVVSDKWQDAQAAHNAGCTSILLKSAWNGLGHHDFVLPTVADVFAKVLQLHASRLTVSALA
ncbi:MAG: HAD-IIIA family hydrolase [Verrucomicrobia bacterium]|nr:HAD-IIIA family hydrolase [Verrucomicrobiota bacterium]